MRPTLLLLSTTRLSFCDLCSAAAAATDDRYNGKRGRRRWVASTCFFRSPTAPMSITRQRQLRNRMTFKVGEEKLKLRHKLLQTTSRIDSSFSKPLYVTHSLANKLLLTDANACANEVSAVAPAAAAAAAAATTTGSAAINCDE
ncbi:hypothetical protein T05_15484 [Trichinella murrelli]|uniref:Secreted protein n=1 Tax=Trichinella murrelli TaxID=144512 RepID=A0A0V0U4M9_9BILA|nr:hypothetical protein T05_15484 [Trichinella murrelli]